MERKIGEIFEYNGEWYQCVYNIHGNCDGCSFSHINSFEYGSVCCESYLVDIHGKCGKVIFKKLEKVGEPITVNGKNVQLLKTTIANCDNCAFYKDVNCDFTCYPRKCHGGEEGTYVEIKQNKEDMEENKLNLKPFDIQKAREGKPVCTRDGRKARIICFDMINKCDYPIIALLNDGQYEYAFYYSKDGKCNVGIDLDLMMLPEKKEGWVNVYKDSVYDTKEEALAGKSEIRGYIDTIKISWSE